MPVFPMLPEIDKNENKFLAGSSGVWTKYNDSDFITSLVNSLKSGNALSDVGNIDSIPDVWAKPLLFKMALFDIGAAREFVAGLHDRVTGEWRALLAMFALKNLKQINLRAEAVPLDAEKNDFARVFTDLRPVESFNGDADAWLTDIHVIFYNDMPLAMTSPVTLVASAADYSGVKLNLPWSRGGKILEDPIKNLLPNELFALSAWLKNLHSDLQKISLDVPTAAQSIANSLLKCIKLYSDDVDKKIGVASASAFTFVDSGMNLNAGTARLLNTTVAAPAASIADSYVRLVTNPARKNKKLLLVSPKMVQDLARKEYVDAAQFVIWQGVNANDVSEKSLQNGRSKIGRISLGDTEYRRPEDFFYEQIAVVDKTGDSFPGALKISGANILAEFGLTAILPIKRELLELFSPEEICARLSFTAQSYHNISLHFNFPLSGVNGAGAEFHFTKNYSVEDLIYLQQEIPAVEFWPNIYRAGWKKYYLYYENAQAQSQENSEVLLDDMYYVEPWTFGVPLKDFPAQGLRNRITAQLENFPEALIFNYKASASAAAAEIGLILLKKPATVARQAGLTWNIGVDFGTSSTMLYFSQGNNSPAPLDFEPRLFQITKSEGARAQTSMNFISSMPKRRLDGSFLSMFHLLDVENPDEKIRPLLDGHILSDDISPDFFKSISSRLDTNLKWQKDPQGRLKVAAYIGQICLQSLVEAAANGVDKIQWNFSYPTAFSKKQTAAFGTSCQKAIDDACQNTGFASGGIAMISESEAAAYYFNNLHGKNANFTQGAVCIDIGAGTTDITVISGKKVHVIYHASIQYAGRCMFKPIYDNYKIFSGQNLSDQTLIDIDMRNNSDKYVDGLAALEGQEIVRDVLQGCQLAVGGLFYYLGKIIGELHGAGAYTQDTIPHVFVGGNGSRIFQWLTYSRTLKNNFYLDVLEKMLRDASGLKGFAKFHFNQSEAPKIEVASGMITPDAKPADFFDAEKINETLFGKDTALYDSVLAGAEFSIGGKKFTAADFINANDVSAGINVLELTEFQKFITCFNSAKHLWSGGIPLDMESAEEILLETDGYYVKMQGVNPAEIFLEPVFIVELKNLMEMLSYE